MRTTLTIDDPIFEALKRAARDSGKPFKQVVNETLRSGLNTPSEKPTHPYRLQPVSLGRLRADIDLNKALHLADELEEQAIAEELERGR